MAEVGLIADQALLTDRDRLLRIWVWIERIESFCADVDEISLGSFQWQARCGLMEAGIQRLLNTRDHLETKERDELCEALGCKIYHSVARRNAMAACGWAGKFDLANIIGECEELGEYERSAWLCVCHGDIGAAVNSLQRGASAIRIQLENKPASAEHQSSAQYAETMELVSYCIAGYHGGQRKKEMASSSVWHEACEQLLKRVEFSRSSRSSSRVSYVVGLLTFLISLTSKDDHEKVLSDPTLSLGDKAGFACRFLPEDRLKDSLQRFVDECLANGNIEGIIVTGLNQQGMKILQAYVDSTSDVQTAALVTSRIIFPSTWISERRLATEWLDSYRELLNTWQMWQSRAMFDVDRASLLRKQKPRDKSRDAARKSKAQSRRYDQDVQAAIPSQVDPRCTYCSSPLFPRQNDNVSYDKLTKMKKMKNVLNCCPTCQKPLPRCSVCMLPLGIINPCQELHRQIKGSAVDMSSIASLPFAEWFAWCARCKHGGHAHHLVGWFANNESCPVSSCDCKCQFDGDKKLNRPALAASPTNPDEINE